MDNYKDVTVSQEKNNIVCKFKYHCESVYIRRKLKRFYLRRDQHISTVVRNWKATVFIKPTIDHL